MMGTCEADAVSQQASGANIKDKYNEYASSESGGVIDENHIRPGFLISE